MEKDIISKINGIKIQHTCNKCGNVFQIPIFPYINFQENPQYYAKVKNLDIFKVKCQNCKNQQYIKYDTLIVNPQHKYFLYLFTNDNVQLFRNHVKYFVNTVLNKSQINDWNSITTRLVTDLNQLIQKMTIFQIGLNDKAIQFIKRGLIDRDFAKSKNKILMFDGINQTNLQFIDLDQNISKINVNINFYNKIIQNINNMKQEKIDFDLVNQNWVLKRIE